MSKEQKVKVVVLKPCHDKITKERFTVGAEIELDQERADAAVEAGLVEVATPGI
jgi:hypothetical protein